MDTFLKTELVQRATAVLEGHSLKCKVIGPQDRSDDVSLHVQTREGQTKEYLCEVRANLNSSDVMRLNLLRQQSSVPILLVTPYVSVKRGLLLRQDGIEFVDMAGNVHVELQGCQVFVNGLPKALDTGLPEKPKAGTFWKDTVIKGVFSILNHGMTSGSWKMPVSMEWLKAKAGLSAGSASAARKKLLERGSIEKVSAGTFQVLNPANLLDDWLKAYSDVLYPKLLLGQVYVTDLECDGLAGGETAAAKLTGTLLPGEHTLYIDEPFLKWKFRHTGKLVEAAHPQAMQLSLRGMFWTSDDDSESVPLLLVYADLMASGIGRNIETAQDIYERYLKQYFDGH